MIAIGLLFVRMLCDLFKPRPRLEAEIPNTAASAQCPAAAHAAPSAAFALGRPRPVHLALSSLPVCTENLILIDYVTESPNVNGDDRAAMLPADPVRLAVQVEEPT